MPTTLPPTADRRDGDTRPRTRRPSAWDVACGVGLTLRLRRNNKRLERACKAADLKEVSRALADGEDLLARIERRIGQ